MKTIKYGNKELLKKYKYFECPKCGWIGKAEEKEYECEDYYNTQYYWVRCIVCNTRASEIVNKEKLTKVKEIERENDKSQSEYYAEFAKEK